MKARCAGKAIAVVMVFVIGWAAQTVSAADEPAAPLEVDRLVDGLNVDEWAEQSDRWHRAAARYLNRSRQLKRAIRFDPEVRTAINLACTIYGQCTTLWRKIGCETGGTFSRWSANRTSTAKGLGQFLDTTWDSTPFRRFSVYDPYANALAMGWMHTHGRSGEWVCR